MSQRDQTPRKGLGLDPPGRSFPTESVPDLKELGLDSDDLLRASQEGTIAENQNNADPLGLDSLPLVSSSDVLSDPDAKRLTENEEASRTEDPDDTYVSTDIIPKKPTSKPNLGRYEVLDKLAAGGMAEIFLAQKNGSNEVCVIKRLHDHLARDPIVGSRFVREAEVAALLHHKNIARLTDAGHEGGAFYLAMEYIPGRDLETLIFRLRRNRRLPPYSLTLAIGLEVLEGLEYAHNYRGPDGMHLEIVHRDLSPRNIMLTYSGAVKIIDFGLARTNLGAFRTAPGMVLGTLKYMSPEQAMAEPVDHRSDLYSWAAVLHEMLTGRATVAGKNAQEILYGVLTEVPEPVSRLNETLPKALDPVFEKALTKERDQRFQSAAEFREALRVAGESLGIAEKGSIGQFTTEMFPEEYQRAMSLLRRARGTSRSKRSAGTVTRTVQHPTMDELSMESGFATEDGEAFESMAELMATHPAPEQLDDTRGFGSTDSGQFLLGGATLGAPEPQMIPTRTALDPHIEEIHSSSQSPTAPRPLVFEVNRDAEDPSQDKAGAAVTATDLASLARQAQNAFVPPKSTLRSRLNLWLVPILATLSLIGLMIYLGTRLFGPNPPEVQAEVVPKRPVRVARPIRVTKKPPQDPPGQPSAVTVVPPPPVEPARPPSRNHRHKTRKRPQKKAVCQYRNLAEALKNAGSGNRGRATVVKVADQIRVQAKRLEAKATLQNPRAKAMAAQAKKCVHLSLGRPAKVAQCLDLVRAACRAL